MAPPPAIPAFHHLSGYVLAPSSTTSTVPATSTALHLLQQPSPTQALTAPYQPAPTSYVLLTAITPSLNPYTLLALLFFLLADTIYSISLYRSCRVFFRINRPEWAARCTHAALLALCCYASSALYVICWLVVLEGDATATAINKNAATTSPSYAWPGAPDDSHGYDVSITGLIAPHPPPPTSTPTWHYHPSQHLQPQPNITLRTLALLIPSWISYFVCHQAANRFAMQARRDLVDEERWVWRGAGGGAVGGGRGDARDAEKGVGYYGHGHGHGRRGGGRRGSGSTGIGIGMGAVEEKGWLVWGGGGRGRGLVGDMGGGGGQGKIHL